MTNNNVVEIVVEENESPSPLQPYPAGRTVPKIIPD